MDNILNHEDLDNQKKENVKSKPYKCQICMKCFSSNGLLKSHTIQVHKIPFFRQRRKDPIEHTCNICEASFPKRHGLKRHIRQVHEGKIWPYQCNNCEFDTFKVENLEKHAAECNGINLNFEENSNFEGNETNTEFEKAKKSNEKIEEFRRFKCYRCNFTSNNLKEISKHVKIHKRKPKIDAKRFKTQGLEIKEASGNSEDDSVQKRSNVVQNSSQTENDLIEKTNNLRASLGLKPSWKSSKDSEKFGENSNHHKDISDKDPENSSQKSASNKQNSDDDLVWKTNQLRATLGLSPSWK